MFFIIEQREAYKNKLESYAETYYFSELKINNGEFIFDCSQCGEYTKFQTEKLKVIFFLKF